MNPKLKLVITLVIAILLVLCFIFITRTISHMTGKSITGAVITQAGEVIPDKTYGELNKNSGSLDEDNIGSG